jgi:hypothetical protein
MTTKESLPSITVSRRKLLRNGLLAGLGAAALGIASPVLTGTARAQESYPQDNWNWCYKCKGMFYATNTDFPAGYCPAGGQHTGNNPYGSPSYNYTIYYNASQGKLSQSSWNWCNKCTGLFYGPQQSSSWCPAGGQHNGTGSYDYWLQYDQQELGTANGNGWQEYWNWCSKCTGLFFGPQQSSSYCPAGGQHNGSGSFDYWLIYIVPGT